MLLFGLMGAVHSLLYIIYQQALNSNKAFNTAIFGFVLDSWGLVAGAILYSYGLETSIYGGLSYSLGGAVLTYWWLKRADQKRS